MSDGEAMPIEAVLFDYGQVLSGAPDPAAWARMRAVTGLGEDALHEAYWLFRHEYDRGGLSGRAYWQEVARHAGVRFDAEQIAALLDEDVDLWTKLNLPMVEWAARLQDAGVRTGILSNIGDAIAEGICARLGWLARFDHCTWSHALKLAKPDAAIYVATAEALGVAPARILFIDDRAENVAAAEAVEMQAIHYTGHGEFERAMRERGFGWLLDVGLDAKAAEVAAHDRTVLLATE